MCVWGCAPPPSLSLSRSPSATNCCPGVSNIIYERGWAPGALSAALFSADPDQERLPPLRTCARRNQPESNANYLVTTERISLFLSKRSAQRDACGRSVSPPSPEINGSGGQHMDPADGYRSGLLRRDGRSDVRAVPKETGWLRPDKTSESDVGRLVCVTG